MKNNNKNIPSVVIFGRTNVGKSTLFNRLTEKNQALVANIEGTTRDSNLGQVDWRGVSFALIDTGGIMDLKYLLGKKPEGADDVNIKVQEQARNMLLKADLILFLVDNIAGLLPYDKQMALILKKTLPQKKNIILVANKADGFKKWSRTAEFHKLALGDPIPISSATGSGTGDLLDIIVARIAARLDAKNKKSSEQKIQNSKFKIQNSINVCILGQPNVGKSSLLNSILGEPRVIVSPVPHTTREPQDTDIVYKDEFIKLIDTAGISRSGQKNTKANKNRVRAENLTKLGIIKSLSVLNKTDIALFVIDINKTITRQDAKIIAEITERQKSLIIIANKWDLVPEKNTKKYTAYIYAKLPFAQWAPIQFTSALTGAKTKKIMDLILKINEQRKKEITDSQLNTFLMRIVKIHKPAKGKGVKHPHIHKFTQIKSNPPKFELRIGAKDDLHFSYVRFIENRLREKFGFLGTPIRIRVVKNKPAHRTHA